MHEGLTSKENLLGYGDHLDEVRTILAAAGLSLYTLTPEIASHIGEDESETIARFCRDTLKPCIAAVDRLLDDVADRLTKAEGDTGELEALFGLEAS